MSIIFLLLYADDVIIASTSQRLTLPFVNLFGKQFRISFSVELKSYLNVAIEHDCVGKTVYLSQSRYMKDMISQFDIPVDKSVNTPMQENLKLLATEEEILSPKQSQYVAKFPYRQLMGVIIYLNLYLSCGIVCCIYLGAVQLESCFLGDQGASVAGQVLV